MPALRPEERREFQRLVLQRPVSGTLGDTPVTIMEVGILGARVRHAEPLASEYLELSFERQGNRVRMKCEVVRTMKAGDPAENVLQSGLRFLAAVDDSGDHLRGMLGDLVSRELELRRSTPAQPVPMEMIDGDNTVRGKDASFLSYRFERGGWTKRRIFLPEQPASGFTVASGEDVAEMSRLCRVFEASDEEGRRLIRLFAELSVSELLQIPPRMSAQPSEA